MWKAKENSFQGMCFWEELSAECPQCKTVNVDFSICLFPAFPKLFFIILTALLLTLCFVSAYCCNGNGNVMVITLSHHLRHNVSLSWCVPLVLVTTWQGAVDGGECWRLLILISSLQISPRAWKANGTSCPLHAFTCLFWHHGCDNNYLLQRDILRPTNYT